MASGRNNTRKRRKNYVWEFRPENAELAGELQQRLRISPAFARVLANRGLADQPAHIEEFVNPRLQDLHDPFLMLDMETAVERVIRASIRSNSRALAG